MSVSRTKAWDYAEEVLSHPARDIQVRLRHGKGGFTLLHRGRALTRCYDSSPGRIAAGLVAEALGVALPPLGHSIDASVSTGVLYRALSLSSIDPRPPEVRPLVRRLLEEAIEMRGTSAGAGDS